MLDLKLLNAALDQLHEERGIPRKKIIEAIEQALATAYKKEYGKRGQIIRAHFNADTGGVAFEQIKVAVDETMVKTPEERLQFTSEEETAREEKRYAKNFPNKSADVEKDDRTEAVERVNYNPEHHIFIEDARKIKKDTQIGDELIFPLEARADYGRIAAQTAKQVIVQKIREAERESVLSEFSGKEGEVVSGTVQRTEKGNIFIDLGRTVGLLPREEQIPGERYRQGERVRAYLYAVDESPRGVYLRLSRTHPQFIKKLFEIESPEITNGSVEIKCIAREAGSRSKIAVISHDEYIDPVGSLVGQRGVRVSTVMSELGGEKIDIIEWSPDQEQFIEDAISPAKTLKVKIYPDMHRAEVVVSPDQQSLAIGRGGQNVRLAAKLTGWRIDIKSIDGEKIAGVENLNDEEVGEDKIENAY